MRALWLLAKPLPLVETPCPCLCGRETRGAVSLGPFGSAMGTNGGAQAAPGDGAALVESQLQGFLELWTRAAE